jgi:hypothetical protein
MSSMARGRGTHNGVRQRILLIRDQRIMLDSDLAALYGVPTKVLVQSVKRNLTRFPEDFMFRLTMQETAALRSHRVTSKNRRGRGGRRYPPYAFTEQGVAMLSGVLRSHRAIEVNIAIMRTFVQIRRMLASDEAFLREIKALEKKYDAQFKVVFDAIRWLTAPSVVQRPAIGFRPRPASDGGEGSAKVARARRRPAQRRAMSRRNTAPYSKP